MKRTLRFAIYATAILLLAVCAANAQAPAKKPITHETLWMMKRVGAPVVSPDGTVTTTVTQDPVTVITTVTQDPVTVTVTVSGP